MVLLFTACDKKEDKEDYSNVQGNYFSINQYILDQWNTFAGEPFVIQKTTWVNGKTMDSSYTNSDTINWARLFAIFSATDISDRKYLGQYSFNQFDDNQDGTHNFFYMAKDHDLFTQKLLLTVDQENMKVKGIYIETYKKSATDECTQKLYYSPMKKIQIQWDDRPVFGGKKHTVQEYEFMR
ncbi:MAG: hypothetical protein K0Q79_2123 [Flavipsychrobacter sp.]|nr:hypothetical protein [Flavipsychrobacter sp.]